MKGWRIKHVSVPGDPALYLDVVRPYVFDKLVGVPFAWQDSRKQSTLFPDLETARAYFAMAKSLCIFPNQIKLVRIK